MSQPSKRYRTIVLIFLTAVYAFSFIDHSIINFLSPIIREDLGLEAWQMGLLKGMAFALFYTLLGLPLAWLADRYNRVNIMTICLVIWSGFTALTGMANNFMQIGLARIGVGIGEAGGSPPAHSMISDLYPKEQRASALSFHSLGIPLGLMFAYFVTGVAASGDEFNWRGLLIKLGIAGIVLAVFVRLIVREPKRGAQESQDLSSIPQEPFFKALKGMLSIPSWWVMCFGISLASFGGYAFSAWQIDYLMPFDAGSTAPWGFSNMMFMLALINGIAYGGGTYMGGFITDRLAKKSVKAYGYVPAITTFLAVPFGIAAFWAPTVMGHMISVTIFCFLIGMYLGPTFSVAQTLAPINMRAMSTAAFFLILNIIALGGGPTTAGFIISALEPQYGNVGAIRIAMTIIVLAYAVGGVFFLMATRHLPKDWADAQKRNEGVEKLLD